jgi:hypothetical protein
MISELYRQLSEAFAEDDGQTYSEEPLPDEVTEDDPWAEPAPARQERRSAGPRPSQRQSQGNRQSQPQSRQSAGNGQRSGTLTDDVGKRWTFGQANAPLCYGNDNHDPEPAALVNGKGRNGKAYKAWACPLGYGDTWRDKCDLFDFDVSR